MNTRHWLIFVRKKKYIFGEKLVCVVKLPVPGEVLLGPPRGPEHADEGGHEGGGEGAEEQPGGGQAAAPQAVQVNLHLLAGHQQLVP